jgi:SAM-dependent methyltransferase
MSKAVRDFYGADALREWQRADTPYSRLEFQSTLHLIGKYFPARGHIADIGGGPGRYTLELLRRGYEVTLFDLTEELLQLARAQIEAAGLHANAVLQGDARDLSALASETFDGALLMGPLYHTAEAQDRTRILSEQKRTLKPGGVALAAYLNSWGVIRTGLTDFPQRFGDLGAARAMLGDFDLGIWHLSTPEGALAEVQSAGFEVIAYAGAEGFAGGMRSTLDSLAKEHPQAYENVVQLAVETSEVAQYRDTTDHLHVLCRKPHSA